MSRNITDQVKTCAYGYGLNGLGGVDPKHYLSKRDYSFMKNTLNDLRQMVRGAKKPS